MDPSILSDQTYEIFSKQLHERASQNRMPISATVEVTMRCNLHCQHCYIPLEQRKAKHPDELSLDEFKRVFSEFADAGTLWLLFTGGEPFLRPDFLDIYAVAKQFGFIITIFTNGTLINDRIVEYLAEWRPFNIEISLYGSTQQTYEKITGIPGSYQRCLQGIEGLLQNGLPLELKAPLMTLNAHELKDMKKMAANLGVGFHFDPVITAGINGDLTPTAFRLPPEEIIQYELNDEHRASTWPEKIASYKDKNIEGSSMYNCGAGAPAFIWTPLASSPYV